MLEAASVQQTMQIDVPPDHSITFPTQSGPRNVSDGNFNVEPLATVSSTLNVSNSSLTPAVCSIVGSSITPEAPGQCTVASNQEGGLVDAVAFNAAAQVMQSMVVQASQTIDSPLSLNQVWWQVAAWR